MMYFVLSVRYIRIKQSIERNKIQQLTDNLLAKSTCLATEANLPMLHDLKIVVFLWRKYKQLNERVFALYKEITNYDRFWRSYLVIYFVGYIVDICYISYGLLIVESNGAFTKIFFSTFAVQFAIYLLLMTYQCSRLVDSNLTIHKEHCKFLSLYRSKMGKQSQILNTGNLLKVRIVVVLIVVVKHKQLISLTKHID